MAEAEAPANVNVTSALPDDIREGLAVENIKTIAGATAFYAAQMHGNKVSHQNRLDMIAEAAVGKIVESIIATSPNEGGVDIAALQQLMKGAQTTPPVTP